MATITFEHILALWKEYPGIIITLSPKTAQYLHNFTSDIKLGNKHGEELLNYLDVDVIVYPGMRKINSIDKFHVLVNHGVSDKTIIKSIGGDFDLILIPGQRDYERLKTAKVNLDKYVITGYNKFCLFKDMQTQKLFNNGKKTIIYSPTWNYSIASGSSNINSSWKYVGKICEAIGKDYNLIIKPHPVISMMISGNLYTYLKDPNKDNIEYIPDWRSLYYMQEPDLMITDVSSIGYEWLYFNRPIMFINPNKHILLSGMEETYLWQCGIVVNEIDNLRNKIDYSLANPSQYQEQRQKLLEEAYYNPRDGQAAKRAISVIRERFAKFKSKGRS